MCDHLVVNFEPWQVLVTFGREEKEWGEYTQVYFLLAFYGKHEVRRTRSDGLALIEYYAIMAGSSKFSNIPV